MMPPGPSGAALMLHWLGIAIFAATALGLVIAGAMFIWNIKLVNRPPARSTLGRAVVGPRTRRRRERAHYRDHVTSRAAVDPPTSRISNTVP